MPKCGICGGEMSKNPHPDAGNPDKYLEVGTFEVCIPCTVGSRHRLAGKANRLEAKLDKISDLIAGY